MEKNTEYCIYFLECENSKIYIGSTCNLTKRFKQHTAGQGGMWTSNNVPINVIAVKYYQSRSEAYSQEKKLKKYSLAKKLSWIKRNCIYDDILLGKFMKL